MTDRPRVFIGSSAEALGIARGVKANLESVAEVHIWDEGLFRVGKFTLDELLHFTTDYDFAVFVWSGDDRAVIRKQDYDVARDNVVFEAGLFYGALGRDRVYLIAPRQPSVKRLTDLDGLNYLTYIPPTDGNYRAAVAARVSEVEARIKELGKVSPLVRCHGTKHNVPGSHDFWNGLLGSAKKRFYLVGSSNKSWVNKTVEQKVDLANGIYRIVKQGGKVKMISSTQTAIVEAHRRFFREYLRPCVEDDAVLSRGQALDLIRKNFLYTVRRKSNYGALLSDDRLVLLPRMNDGDFRDESLVLELQDPKSQQFKNYLADLERLFAQEALSAVDVIGLLQSNGRA